MSRRLRILAYSMQLDTHQRLNEQLQGLEWVEWQGVYDRLDELAGELQNQSTDVVLIDWENEQTEVIDWLRHNALQPDCGFVVVLLHRHNKPEVLMQAVKFGAREVIDYPLDAELLDLALLRFHNLLGKAASNVPERQLDITELPAEAYRRPCKIVTVFAPKGGAGASCVAVNLAHELRTLTKQDVLLLDVDQVFNNTPLMLNLKPSHALGDLASRNVNELSDDTLDKILVNHESGLKLLASSKSILDNNELITPELLERVTRYARNHFAYVIVDLPSHVLDPYHQYFVDEADEVLVVSGLDVPGLIRTRQYLDLATQFVEQSKLKLVLNRWDLKAAYGMTNKSLEEEFRYPPYARLVNDWELNVEANSLGKPYSQINAEAPLVRNIKVLAHKVAGLDVETLEQELTLSTKRDAKRLEGFINQLFGRKPKQENSLVKNGAGNGNYAPEEKVLY